MKHCLCILILASLLAGGAYAVHGYAWVISSFSTGDWALIPTGIAYDGSNLWITDSFDSTLYKVTPAGSILSTYSLAPILFPAGLDWDGSAFWMIGSPSVNIRYFYHISTSGSVLSSIPGVLTYNYPYGAQYLSGNCWVTSNYYDRKIYLHAMGNGSILSSMQTIAKYPCGICYDGTNLLVTGSSDGITHRYSTSGTYLDYFNSPFYSTDYQGDTVWVGSTMYQVNAMNKTVYQIAIDWNPPSTEPTSLGVVRSLFK